MTFKLWASSNLLLFLLCLFYANNAEAFQLPKLKVLEDLKEKLSETTGQTPETTQGTASGEAVPHGFNAAHCLRGQDLAGADDVVKVLLQQTESRMPLNMQRYLTGFCLPAHEGVLKQLYLYLVGQGAMHARLTLVKYDELIALFDEAGLDLGVRRDAIQRSVNTLDADVRTYDKDRMKGARRLVDHVDADVVTKVLKELTANYHRLEQRYRQRAQDIMATVFSHSFSSSFYLSRGTYTARKLLMDTRSLKQDGSLVEGFLHNPANFFKKWDVGMFVANKKDEMYSMLVASAHAIKTFTQDIKDIPRIDHAVTNKELAALREKNGVTLNAFEQAFEKDQQSQLNRAGA